MLRISSMVQLGASSSRSVSRLQSRHIHQSSVIWALDACLGCWGCFQDGSPTRLFTGGCSTPPCERFYRAAWVSSQHHGSWLSSDQGKEWQGSYRASSDQVSEVICHYFCHIPFISSKSLHPVHTQGKGIKSHLLKREGSTNFWICFKTVTPLYPSSSPYDPDKWQAKRTWGWNQNYSPWPLWNAAEQKSLEDRDTKM